ncbi:hypothetical protein ACEZDJ_39735, partial [Streptacidiphilus sp. N1-5]
ARSQRRVARWPTLSAERKLPGSTPPAHHPTLIGYTTPRDAIPLVKRGIGNLAAADLSQITRAVKRKLKMLQYRPEVLDGCLAGAGLSMALSPDRRWDENARPLTTPGMAASSPCHC